MKMKGLSFEVAMVILSLSGLFPEATGATIRLDNRPGRPSDFPDLCSGSAL